MAFGTFTFNSVPGGRVGTGGYANVDSREFITLQVRRSWIAEHLKVEDEVNRYVLVFGTRSSGTFFRQTLSA